MSELTAFYTVQAVNAILFFVSSLITTRNYKHYDKDGSGGMSLYCMRWFLLPLILLKFAFDYSQEKEYGWYPPFFMIIREFE